MFGWLGSGTGPDAPETGAPGPGRTGLAGAVRVATPDGWRPVGEIEPGDDILTFDAGLQRVETVFSEPVWPGTGPCPPALWPVEVAPGVLGNRDLIHLAPDQLFLIESDEAEARTGDPFALLSAESLADLPGIHRAPPAPEAVMVSLGFAVEQIVFAGGGAMLHCPGAAPDLLDDAPRALRYPRLGAREARAVAARLAGGPDQARSAGLPGIRS
ncbi:Hint domain-containing protein [Roseovarius aquimarinus]|uniref:Hint domain-containing protein n=1 Tax=Roseovarius aquimarinus TaxID=1229156 RepID=A0ABW7I785_9RHOB